MKTITQGDFKMKTEIFEAVQGNHNLSNYEEVYNNFDWKEVEKNFSWHNTGKVNMAYECIDKHVDNGKGDKVALYYKDANREESYTFEEMQRNSNKAANVLVQEAGV